MKKSILIAVAAFALTACGGNAQKKTADADRQKTTAAVPDGHTAQTSLDYEGTYTGTFPAADCPGIEVTLTLHPDGKFTEHDKYIDRDSEFHEKGTYKVEGNLLTLMPEAKGDVMSYYKVEENRLRRLDGDKQPVTGALADNYVLTKTK